MNPWENNESEYYEARPKVTSVYQPNSLQDGVIVPGLQAIITGAVCGLAAGAVTAWFELPFWAIAGTVAALATAGGWLAYRGRWAWVFERLTGADLNADGYIGKPEPQQAPALPASIRVEVSRDEGRAVFYIDLPAKPEKLTQLARGLLAGRSFNQTAWTGSAGVFSRSEFDALRDTMIQRGLLAWRNPESKSQGCDLTAAGRAVIRRLANLSPTLPPTQ